ncbi:hypothetical protein VM1G_12061 [Cytospora mali]|uniref:Uncharacterized protein n=1 Tax=Cytospora mali TaxID=578113 RepID=A0A194VJ34_CYTMA|nr:hypothetical protein VM1G_12061 [Valsa mali]
MHWEITIPNDHIFDAASIANGHECGKSVYDELPWTTLRTWISCSMKETTGYLKFRVGTLTTVTAIQDSFNKGTCNTFKEVNCYKEKRNWIS